MNLEEASLEGPRHRGVMLMARKLDDHLCNEGGRCVQEAPEAGRSRIGAERRSDFGDRGNEDEVEKQLQPGRAAVTLSTKAASSAHAHRQAACVSLAPAATALPECSTLGNVG